MNTSNRYIFVDSANNLHLIPKDDSRVHEIRSIVSARMICDCRPEISVLMGDYRWLIDHQSFDGREWAELGNRELCTPGDEQKK